MVAIWQIVTVLCFITVVVVIVTLILLWAVQERPTMVQLWAQSITHTCKRNIVVVRQPTCQKPHNTLCLSCNSMQRSFISIISGKTTGVKHTIQSSLETAPFSILATVSAPAALWSGNALGALSELGALGRTRIFIWEQTATLTRLTAQWNKGWTHALKENQKQQQSKFSCMAEATT